MRRRGWCQFANWPKQKNAKFGSLSIFSSLKSSRAWSNNKTRNILFNANIAFLVEKHSVALLLLLQWNGKLERMVLIVFSFCWVYYLVCHPGFTRGKKRFFSSPKIQHSLLCGIVGVEVFPSLEIMEKVEEERMDETLLDNQLRF